MVAKFPPLGWNSWDCYGAAVTEDTVRKNADYMAENLKQFGWEYIVVDIQWYQPTANSHGYEPFAPLCMDEYSRLLPAENRFPSAKGGVGFKPLADYVHSLGLKFGIHMMRGIPRQATYMGTKIKNSEYTARQVANPDSICGWNPDMYGCRQNCPGSQEYYNSLFELYAEWGVDFVKVDDICRNWNNEFEIKMIRNAIDACGREMVLSLSPGPANINQAQFLKDNANMWRITDDFWDRWELLYDMFTRAETWAAHVGEGHWPDCDMLPIGAINAVYNPENRTHFTEDEQKTMMSLWCMVRSPLMIGGEMTSLDDFTLSLLNNEELLKIERTTHCAHIISRKVVDGNEQIVWFAPTKAGGVSYVALFNAGESEAEISLTVESLGIEASKAYDIWNKTEADLNGVISAKVAPHGVSLYKLY